jgi:sentrin-specific protease 1
MSAKRWEVRTLYARYWFGVEDRVFSTHSKDQMQNIHSQLIARGMNNVALWDLKGFNNRFGQSVGGFLREYGETAPKERFISEHINPNRPCKLFYDVEYYKQYNDHDEERIKKQVERVVAVTIDELKRLLPDAAHAGLHEDVIITYANNREKASSHVTFQVVFENYLHVKKFVIDHIIPILNKEPVLFMVQSEEGLKNAVDISVYSLNRILRICGSSKFEDGRSKENPLLPRGITRLDKKTLLLSFVGVLAVAKKDAEIVQSNDTLKGILVAKEVWAFKSLGSISLNHNDILQTKRIKTTHTRDHQASVNESSQGRAPSKAEEMVNNLLKTHPLFKCQRPGTIQCRPIEVIGNTHRVTIRISSVKNEHAIRCPNKKSAHKSNGVYFHLNLTTQEGFFRCLDGDCQGKGTWGKGNYKKYLKPEPLNNQEPTTSATRQEAPPPTAETPPPTEIDDAIGEFPSLTRYEIAESTPPPLLATTTMIMTPPSSVSLNEFPSFPLLTPLELGELEFVKCGEGTDTICKRFGASITRHSFSSLEDRRWLNDEVVNTTLYQTQQYYGDNNFIVLNTFFYPCLMRNAVYNYDHVKDWMKKACSHPDIDPFNPGQTKAIFFAIYFESHYSLVVADIGKHELVYYDSLGRDGTEVLQNIDQYLKDEYQHSRMSQPTEQPWTLIAKPKNVPKQPNSTDCGIYMCLFVRYIMKCYQHHQSICFPPFPSNMIRVRQQFALDILHQCCFPVF